jgi:hypothetical protein
MADSGGHWKTLAEAQKLTSSTKIPGVFEEDVKRNNPVERTPVAQASGTGKKIEWLREKTTVEDAVAETDIGDQLTWSDDVEYTEVESTLRRVYVQRKLDHFVEGIYSTYNDYKAQVLLESEKGLKRKIGDRFVYGDYTYGGSPSQWDGIHALAAEKGTPNAAATTTYSDLNLDCATSALSLILLRRMIDAMKHGIDELWMSPTLALRFDQAYAEYGFRTDTGEALQTIVHGDISLLTRGLSDIGKPIMYFMGIPIIRTDYLVKEEDGTGTGASSNARAKYSSTAGYSIFGVKFGDVMAREPGICFGYGGTEGQGDLYKLVPFAELEDFDAGGIRLVTYGTVLLGSTLCLGRIFDITDAAITA